MITQIAEIKLFYPMLFLTIGFIAVVIGIVLIKGKDVKIFNKSSDNIKELALDNNKTHIDTTDKFSKAHTEVITALPQHYEDELHSLEKAVKNTDDKLIALAEDVNRKLDMIIERIVILENNNKNN